MAAGHNDEMSRQVSTIIAAILLSLPGSDAAASTIVCTRPDDPNHTFTVAGDQGAYTWNDHGLVRSWALSCRTQRGGSTSCHRWEQTGANGRSVIIFRMMPDGTLIEAGSWALLDTSTVNVTTGFQCTTGAE